MISCTVCTPDGRLYRTLAETLYSASKNELGGVAVLEDQAREQGLEPYGGRLRQIELDTWEHVLKEALSNLQTRMKAR